MPKYTGPGVFTTEVDQSFVSQGSPGVGAVLIGRTLKGPAFVPVPVRNFQEFVDRFGSLDTKMQMPYAAKNYLENAGIVNIVRVLGHTDGGGATAGYSVGGITGITDRSGSNSVTGSIRAVIHHSGNADVVSVVGVSGDANRFVFTIGSFSTTASFLTSSDDYVEKVLNTDPTRYSTDKHYLYQVFKYSTPPASASWRAVAMSGAMNVPGASVTGFNDFDYAFTSGSTTWVKSQLLGNNEYNLFRFHTLGHGRATNDDVKVSVENVRPTITEDATSYGTFDVVVRKFYDTDLRQEIVEQFSNLTLDPSDRNYIARRIGDRWSEFDTNERKFVTNGDYAQRSSLIRVEMYQNSGAPPQALPWGFRGYPKMKFSGSDVLGAAGANVVPALTYVPNQKDKSSNYNANIHWGVLFVSGGVADRMRAFPDLSTAARQALQTTDSDFSMKHLSGTYENGKLRYHYNTGYTSYAPIYLSASMQAFSMPFYGGFDGFDYTVSNPFDVADSSTDTTLVVAALVRAVDCVADPDYIEADLLAIPGVTNLFVTDRARLVTNERKDMLYVMDVSGATVNDAVNNLKSRDIDDNYTAAYYPDVKINDTVNNRIVRVGPSVAVVGAIAYNDRVAQPFYAPAGMNRGGVSQFGVVDIVDRLNYKDRGTLYDNRLNPIATFPNQGIVVWGQKTLQVKASALDRVNVRRLLITAKRVIAAAARSLVFEPNDPATYQRFSNAVNPILDRIRQDRGIERFQVVMDANLNTPDVVDRNVMIGKIFLQPTRTAEFIDLSFIITNTGVSFNE